VSEAQNIQATESEAIRVCVIIASVIKVEHFEMSSYRGLVTGAQQMGQNQIVNLLSEICSRRSRRHSSPSRAPLSCSRRPGRRRGRREAKTARNRTGSCSRGSGLSVARWGVVRS
jgi:Domain of unknown function (DUF892)